MARVCCSNIVWLAAILLGGCSEPLQAPGSGAIEITSITTGGPADGDGYTVVVDAGAGQALGSNSTIRVSELTAGEHRLELSGVAPHCNVAGAPVRTVEVSGGITARVTFEVTCGTPTGGIEISSITTGEPIDPDGYSVALDGSPGQPIGSNDIVAFTGLIVGDHTVSLTGIAPNCAVEGENSRTLAVGAEVVFTSFEVACGPPTGAILISTATAGLRPDLDGYAVSLDGNAGQAIGSNATLTLSSVPIGDHSLHLSGLAPNCTLAGENILTVSVRDGETVTVTFQVHCSATGEGIILFVSDRTGMAHLYRMQDDGSSIRDLTPSMEAFAGDWSPDGSRIVFTAIVAQASEIFVMNADGSNAVGLGVAGADPRWSPDGRKILFQSDSIRVMNPDGSGILGLTTGGSATWSPDGTRIAFNRTDESRCVGIADLRFCPVDLYVMAASGSQIRRLLTSSTDPSDESRAPAWSPDGTSIAYARRCCFLGPSESGLWVVSPDGGSPTRLDNRVVTGGPVWSPDGSAIAFGATQLNNTAELTLIPSGGGAGTVLASSRASEYPTSWK